MKLMLTFLAILISTSSFAADLINQNSGTQIRCQIDSATLHHYQDKTTVKVFCAEELESAIVSFSSYSDAKSFARDVMSSDYRVEVVTSKTLGMTSFTLSVVK